MLLRSLAITGLLFTAASGSAMADTMPNVDMPQAALPASPLVQAFAQDAGLSNQFEITESQIALEKSSNPAVQRFARRMIIDHGKAEAMLAHASQPSGVATHFMFPAPTQEKIDMLQSLSGPEFDQAYMSDQVDAHASAAAKLGQYAAAGDDPALVAYARKTLPVVQMHQRMLTAMGSDQGPMAMQ